MNDDKKITNIFLFMLFQICKSFIDMLQLFIDLLCFNEIFTYVIENIKKYIQNKEINFKFPFP